MWMTLLYIVAVAVVSVIVAIAAFYIVVLIGTVFGFVAVAKSVGTTSAKTNEEKDIDRAIRIAKKVDRENDRQAKRRRKQRMWGFIFRERIPPAEAPPLASIEQQPRRQKRLGLNLTSDNEQRPTKRRPPPNLDTPKARKPPEQA